MQPSSNINSTQEMNTFLSHQQFQLPFDPTSSHDDFLEQMLSSINAPSSPWPDLSDEHHHYHFDDQSQLATKFRNHQINASGSAKALMLQHHRLRPPPPPITLADVDQNAGFDGSSSTFKSTTLANDSSVQPIFNGFGGSLSQIANQPQHFNTLQAQNLGSTASAAAMTQAPPPSGSTGAGGGSGAPTQPRQQRVRARRGQATDPHSIAERLRRERIAERMKALQELVPNANKTDKASMLDEIIDYVKFLQLQVKVLSMSRLGGAGAVAPPVADISSQARGDGGRTNNGTQTASPLNNDKTSTITEHQVAKLMEQDMGSAMQYLQGKGLCLMPISLATAISTATCHSSRNPLLGSNGGGEACRPSSPNVSMLSVQSATVANGIGEASVKEDASVSKS